MEAPFDGLLIKLQKIVGNLLDKLRKLYKKGVEGEPNCNKVLNVITFCPKRNKHYSNYSNKRCNRGI